MPGLAAFVTQIVLASAWAYFAHHWYFRTFKSQLTAIIYDGRVGMTQLIESYGLTNKYDVQLKETARNCVSNVEIFAAIQTVFCSGVRSHDRNIIIKYCIGNDINVLVIPRIGDTLMSSATPSHMFHLPIVSLRRYMLQPEYLFIKRA